MARRSARALMTLDARGIKTRDLLTEASLHNAMVTHAAFGGSTNLILHVPAIAPRPGCRDQPPAIGRPSIVACRESSTPCQTGLAIIQQFRYSWLAASLK